MIQEIDYPEDVKSRFSEWEAEEDAEARSRFEDRMDAEAKIHDEDRLVLENEEY